MKVQEDREEYKTREQTSSAVWQCCPRLQIPIIRMWSAVAKRNSFEISLAEVNEANLVANLVRSGLFGRQHASKNIRNEGLTTNQSICWWRGRMLLEMSNVSDQHIEYLNGAVEGKLGAWLIYQRLLPGCGTLEAKRDR